MTKTTFKRSASKPFSELVDEEFQLSMGNQRRKPTTDAIEIVNRVLDKGIVADATVSVGLLGVRLPIDIDAQVVVASLETYERYAKRNYVAEVAGAAVERRTEQCRAPVTKAQSPRGPNGAAPAPATGLRAPRENRVPSARRIKAVRKAKRTAAGFSSTDTIRARGLGVLLECGHPSERGRPQIKSHE